jgi:hypothetical protein
MNGFLAAVIYAALCIMNAIVYSKVLTTGRTQNQNP